MQDITRDLLVSLASIGAIFGIIYVAIMTRFRERMSMLEKGVDPSLFSSRRSSPTLKFGMLSIGISLGLLIGSGLYNAGWLERPVAFFSMILLFGGASLIINYLVELPKK